MDNKWWPIVASIGVGAATYYTISRKNSNVGQAIQNMLPIVSELGTGRGRSGSQSS